MLVITLVVKQQIARLGLGDIAPEEAAVVLDQRCRAGIGRDLAGLGQPTIAQQLTLCGAEFKRRRQAHTDETIVLTPGVVMHRECLGRGKAHQTRTIAMRPAWIRAPHLLFHQTCQPGAKAPRLRTIELCLRRRIARTQGRGQARQSGEHEPGSQQTTAHQHAHFAS